jgi:hypothetical protein
MKIASILFQCQLSGMTPKGEQIIQGQKWRTVVETQVRAFYAELKGQMVASDLSQLQKHTAPIW